MNEAVYEVIGNELRVKLSDELDHHNASTIRATIDEMILSGKIRNVVFDFENTKFMDSSGIGIIMGRYKLLRAINGKVSVCNLESNVDRIFMISGLYKIIERK